MLKNILIENVDTPPRKHSKANSPERKINATPGESEKKPVLRAIKKAKKKAAAPKKLVKPMANQDFDFQEFILKTISGFNLVEQQEVEVAS